MRREMLQVHKRFVGLKSHDRLRCEGLLGMWCSPRATKKTARDISFAPTRNVAFLRLERQGFATIIGVRECAG
jgi:hypothetical protein